MKSHEREYFVSRIRSGVQVMEGNEISLKIIPLSIDDTYLINNTFMKAFNKAQEDGFLTHEEMLEESKKRGLWTDEDEKKEKGLQKDIDRLKVELFNNRNVEQTRGQIRTYLKAGKDQLGVITEKKFTNFVLQLTQPIIMASHQLSLLENFDEIIWLDNGKIVSVGPPCRILSKYRETI